MGTKLNNELQACLPHGTTVEGLDSQMRLAYLEILRALKFLKNNHDEESTAIVIREMIATHNPGGVVAFSEKEEDNIRALLDLNKMTWTDILEA